MVYNNTRIVAVFEDDVLPQVLLRGDDIPRSIIDCSQKPQDSLWSCSVCHSGVWAAARQNVVCVHTGPFRAIGLFYVARSGDVTRSDRGDPANDVSLRAASPFTISIAVEGGDVKEVICPSLSMVLSLWMFSAAVDDASLRPVSKDNTL